VPSGPDVAMRHAVARRVRRADPLQRELGISVHTIFDEGFIDRFAEGSYVHARDDLGASDEARVLRQGNGGQARDDRDLSHEFDQAESRSG